MNIFISYRRESAAGEARALFTDLTTQLGQRSVFMDVDSIALGRDFRTALQRTLASCDTMLVVIDEHWADVRGENGELRLHDPADFVRLEIETGLKRDIRVTPVLVGGAHMPTPEKLPEEIKELAYRNAFELSHSRWASDVREMVRRLEADTAELTERDEPNQNHSISDAQQHRTGVHASIRVHPWFIRGGIAAIIVVVLAIGGRAIFFPVSSDKIPQPNPVSFSVRDFLGGWKNSDTNTRGITWISVRQENEKLMVQAWGRCHPTDCDWGTVEAKPFHRGVNPDPADKMILSIEATFSTSFDVANMNLKLTSSDTLTSDTVTHFTDNSGRADYESTQQFLRAPTSLPTEGK